jgi:hypothetical protein
MTTPSQAVTEELLRLELSSLDRSMLTSPDRKRVEVNFEAIKTLVERHAAIRASLASAGEGKKLDANEQAQQGYWESHPMKLPAPAPRDLEGGSDIVKKLRAAAKIVNTFNGLNPQDTLEGKAVTLIEEREAKIEEMRKALELFGKEAGRFGHLPECARPTFKAAFTVGDLRRARRLSGG